MVITSRAVAVGVAVSTKSGQLLRFDGGFLAKKSEKRWKNIHFIHINPKYSHQIVLFHIN